MAPGEGRDVQILRPTNDPTALVGQLNRRQLGAVAFEGNGFQIADHVVGVSDLQVPDGGAIPLQFASYPGEDRFPTLQFRESFLPCALPCRKPQRDQTDNDPRRYRGHESDKVVHLSAPSGFE